MSLAQLLTGIVGLIGVLTGVATYVLTRRQSSGNISTSDAATIFHAAEGVRADLLAMIDRQQAQIAELVAEKAVSRARIAELEIRIAALEGR